MNLVRYNPHRRLARRAHRQTNMFDSFLDDFFGPVSLATSVIKPSENLSLKVDIYEKDDKVVIDAELPGVSKEDVSVDVKGKLLTLGGERKVDEEIKEDNSYRRERSYGKFERTFSLPFDVKSEDVKATFTGGILKLEIAKPEEQQVKKIEIN